MAHLPAPAVVEPDTDRAAAAGLVGMATELVKNQMVGHLPLIDDVEEPIVKEHVRSRCSSWSKSAIRGDQQVLFDSSFSPSLQTWFQSFRLLCPT